MSAKKARFYEVTIRDGHEPYKRFIPAQSKSDLLNNIVIPKNEKLLGVKHLNHHAVEAVPDDESETASFTVNIAGKEMRVGQNDQGYNYLRQQFPDQVKNVEKYFADKYSDEE